MKIIVGITGASALIYGVRLVEELNRENDPYVIVSKGAKAVAQMENDERFQNWYDHTFDIFDNKHLGAPIASGSFPTDGMVVAPCTISTLSDIVHSRNRNLITRAADVCIKEGRKVVLMVRETPLHKGHLKLMWQAADLGYVIMPPMPSFYNHPKTIEDLVDQTTGRILDQFNIPHTLGRRWGNFKKED